MFLPVAFLALVVWVLLGLQAHVPSAVRCVPGECPLELRESDSGGIFTYDVTSRFSVVLDGTTDPQEHLTCVPDGVIGAISNVPSVEPPLYAARFEGVLPGTCTLEDDHFAATIIIQ